MGLSLSWIYDDGMVVIFTDGKVAKVRGYNHEMRGDIRTGRLYEVAFGIYLLCHALAHGVGYG